MPGRPLTSRPGAVVGTVTRGTTNPNRLRRCDRWIVARHARYLRGLPEPVVVDLGYGASPVTALELDDRLRPHVPGLEVVGIEIDPARVAAARPLERPGLTFRRGGFEVPLEGRRPGLVRAFNVLRQYDESQVPGAWATTADRLAPGGVLVDGTCDELGRLATWVEVTVQGPRSLTLSWRLRGLGRPSVIAERLPKALIHHNVDGEPVHALLRDLDAAWERAAGHGGFGVRQRFLATVDDVRGRWPVEPGPSRWRLGEITLPWTAVAPAPTG